MASLLLASTTVSAAVVGAAAPATAAPSVYTVTGTVFHDADRDGSYSLGDLPLANATVDLYTSAADAASRTGAVRTATTNALGVYTAAKLPAGTYYAAASAAGYRSTAVTETAVTGLSLVGVADVAATKQTDLTATVFADSNGNGLRDTGEGNLDGKTLIFIDVLATKKAIEDGSLASIDVGSAITGALGGSLDLGDAIRFRTTANDRPVTFSDVPAGAYVVMRSPFNLTIGDLLANTSRVTALIDLISSGSADALLAMDPSLLDTGDISTTPRSEYLHALASGLSRAVAVVDEADTERLLGADASAQLGTITGTVAKAAGLVGGLPATHFAVVDRWGTGYQLTDLKVKKTTDFLFGVRQPVSITGTVFTDSNANGKKDGLETSEAVTLTAYRADGTVLGSTKTPALLGSYKLGGLPYDTDIYVGLSGTTKTPSVRFAGEAPAALADVTLIGSYRLAGADTADSVRQDLGLATLTAPAATVGAVSASGTATLTLTNTTSAAVSIGYRVNGGASTASTVPAKPLLGSAGTRTITLTGLVPGENTVTIDWSAGVYDGGTLTLPVVR
ncbi:SdrD B-like domain-containing protein [Microbacterium sp. X-17]|uniref:SdrD B-like domain-containing protein n=1 Tax=Microbacterium sp. X-17 TaxID=3144404 RepID=UPI0031F5679D